MYISIKQCCCKLYWTYICSRVDLINYETAGHCKEFELHFFNKSLKGAWGQNSPLFLWHNFNDFMEKELWTKFLLFWSTVLTIPLSYKLLNPAWVTSYPRMCKMFHLWFSLHIFVNSIEKEPFSHFCDQFDHFSWTYKVAKFWMIK